MIIKKFKFWILSILLVQAISLRGMEEGDTLVYGKKGPYWSDLPYKIQKKICKYAGLFEKYRCVCVRGISVSRLFGDRSALSPSGEKWACVWPNRNIVIGDIQGDKIIGSYKEKCIGLAWDPSGDRLLVSFPDETRELEMEKRTDVLLQNGYGSAISSVVSPSQQEIVHAFPDGIITMSKKDGSVIHKTLPPGEGNNAFIAWSSTGKRIICSKGSSGTIFMYDKALNLRNIYSSGGEVTSLCCSREEIIAGLKDGSIDVWNIKSGEVETLSGYIEVKSLVSPSMRSIVSLSKDGTVKHWSRDWMKPIRKFIFKEEDKEIQRTVNLLRVLLLEHDLSKARVAGRKYKLTWEKLAYFRILSDEMQAGYKGTIEMPQNGDR